MVMMLQLVYLKLTPTLSLSKIECFLRLIIGKLKKDPISFISQLWGERCWLLHKVMEEMNFRVSMQRMLSFNVEIQMQALMRVECAIWDVSWPYCVTWHVFFSSFFVCLIFQNKIIKLSYEG